MKRVIILLLILVAATVVAQQPIKGTLRNAKDHSAIPFANVSLLRAADSSFVTGATTNERGIFIINDYGSKLSDSSAALLLRVSSIGFKTLYYPLTPDISQPLELLLSEGATTLNEVTITAERPIYAMDGEKNLYSVKDDPAVQAGNASDALQNAPGVEVDAEGNITLRGTQSVSIWINDRPSHLTAEGLKQYIKTLPANAIDRIEVIENPSARYSGGGAVVNIILRAKVKRNEFFSFGGNARTLPGGNVWASYVYANEKFSINAFAFVDGSKNSNDTEGGSEMFDASGALSERNTGKSESHSGSLNPGIYLSGNYMFDTLNDLTFWAGVNGNRGPHSIHGTLLQEEFIYHPGAYNYTYFDSAFNSGLGGYFGVDFTHKFNNDGHRIDLSVSGNLWKSSNPQESYRRYDLYPALNYDDQSLSKSLYSGVSFSADYVRPFAQNWEWELGTELGFSNSTIDQQRDTLLADGTYQCDDLRTYGYVTMPYNFQGYTTLQRRFGNFTVKAGVRATYKHLSIAYTDNSTYDNTKHYFYLIPSLHLSYRTENMHNFSLSYTLRSNTTTSDDISSRIIYGIDYYSLGNSDLVPERSHHFTAAWTKYFTQFGSVGLEAIYKLNQNELGQFSDVAFCDIFGRIVSFSQPVNIGASSYGGLDANATFRPSAFVNIRLQAGVFNNYYKFQFRPDEWYEQDKWYFRARLNGWAKLWNVLNLFANLSYNTATLTLMDENSDNFSVDMGISAELCDRHISLFAYVANLFDSNNDTYSTLNPYLSQTSTTYYHDRTFMIGINFRFGKLELEHLARTGGMM